MEMDLDLQAMAQARELAKQAGRAQEQLCTLEPSRLDAIVQAVAEAFYEQAEPLARMAAEETGFGNVKDKTFKNQFASQRVYKAIAPMKTLGVLKEDKGEKLWEVGVPVGVIGAIVPSTNPTSTVCYKALISLKAGNAIVFSPHPKALKCTLAAAETVRKAALAAGAPEGAVSCLSIPSMAGCRELMKAPEVRLILATGGPAMVQAAYSSGKPAIGVGAGNGPAYLHGSCNVRQALSLIRQSKTFDYGTVCASEQSLILEKELLEAVRETGKELGYYFMNQQESRALGAVLFRPGGAMNPGAVGRPAGELARMAGFSVPEEVQLLVAEEQGVGDGFPYSAEKLCPVLGMFVEAGEEAVLQKVRQILAYEGRGHTFSIHGEDEKLIRRFAGAVPVSRILVNAPAAQGGIGAASGLFPALTLGCGAVGGSSSSNNIGPMDLINIRRVAWGNQEQSSGSAEDRLISLLAEKILERLQ